MIESASINPVLMMVEDILENTFGIRLSLLAFVLLRIACAIVLMNWVLEAFRITPILFLFFLLLPTQMWVENILLMRQIFFDHVTNDQFLKRIYMSYKKSIITQTAASEFAEPETIFLSKILIRFIPIALFICIRMHSIFPLQLYLPAVLFFTPITLVGISFLLSIFVSIYTESLKNITTWEKAIHSYSRKELHKMYKTLRPLGFHAGIGGFKVEVVDDDFIVNVVAKIQDQTIELLILFPESFFI